MKKLFAVLLMFITPAMVLAYSTGPPNGMTGAPGEGTCHNCHATFPINSGNGAFAIDGPITFQGGQTYTISIQISDPGQRRWGFEFTPLDQGTITITDATHTQLSQSGQNGYVKHTSAGTYDDTPDGPTTWSFDWTAPTTPPASITFYAAGNAANSNSANTGDYIYTTSFTTNLVTAIDDEAPLTPTSLALSNFPNPFNPSTTISYQLPHDGQVLVEVYNTSGQRVETLVNGFEMAGYKSINWDASRFPSGVYLYNLTFEGQTISHKMMLVK